MFFSCALVFVAMFVLMRYELGLGVEEMDSPDSPEGASKHKPKRKCSCSWRAIATFLGTTRNNFDGRPVRTLMYEAYAPMAESKMREILREARRAYGVRKACALHRVGEVKIGEASVVLAFASPHRKDALNACAWAIDELKRVVPVWKQEVYADEGADWKANKEWDPAGLARVIRAPPS